MNSTQLESKLTQMMSDISNGQFWPQLCVIQPLIPRLMHQPSDN
jgi:hypothetical protein